MQDTRAAVQPRLATTTLTFFNAWGPIQRSLNPADYGTTVTAYLEVHLKTSSAASPVTAYLKNVTTSLIVGGSSLTTASTTRLRVRSSGFTLDSGINTYEVEYGGASGATYTPYDAVLILVAS